MLGNGTPHPASTVRTNLGSMRNHLVIRSAEIVVAVSGGIGHLERDGDCVAGEKADCSIERIGWLER